MDIRPKRGKMEIRDSEDRAERPVGCCRATHGLIGLDARPVLAKSEANPDTAAEIVLGFTHLVDVLLLLLDFGVLGHVFGRGKVVVIPGVEVRVKGGYKGSLNSTQVFPVHMCKKRVLADLRETCKPT
jgi:hypothetical protein